MTFLKELLEESIDLNGEERGRDNNFMQEIRKSLKYVPKLAPKTMQNINKCVQSLITEDKVWAFSKGDAKNILTLSSYLNHKGENDAAIILLTMAVTRQTEVISRMFAAYKAVSEQSKIEIKEN